MSIKNFLLIFSLVFSISAFSQENESQEGEKKELHRLSFGLGVNIPFSPYDVSHDIGMSVSQQYEFLLGQHWSLIQSLSYNFISGNTVQEFYQNQNVQTEYSNFNIVPFQLGIGFYFGEKQSTFFIHFKGGIAYYQYIDASYPEVIVNGNVVKEAIPNSEESGTFNFFTPSIGWMFKRIQLSGMYEVQFNQASNLNLLNISLSYNIL